MDILISGIACGKTHRACKLAIETDSYLIVRDQQTAKRLAKQFPDMRFPITYDEFFRTSLRGQKNRRVIIDDLDEMVRRQFHWAEIKAATISSIGVKYEPLPSDNPHLPKEYMDEINRFQEEEDFKRRQSGAW